MKQVKKHFKTFVIAAFIFCTVFVVTGCSDSDSGQSAAQSSAEPQNTKQSILKLEEGDALEIPISEISEKASFYPVELGDTRLEIIAVKDKSGTVRTAFNTCRICYDSGRGYYKQSGNYLVCQNCGNSFTAEQVETESGGCNPWPIFAENKTMTDDTISISYEFLDKSRKIFTNRKSDY